MGGQENLKPVQSEEEAREKGRKGGIKSGEARRAKKNMREMAKYLMDMKVSKKMESVRDTLDSFGVDKNDQNYQAAVVVRLVTNAMSGDTSAIRLLGELIGDVNRFAMFGEMNGGLPQNDIIDMAYPPIVIPDNGRNERPKGVIEPQAGPQTMFMTTNADICVYGGAAGGGKTFALLMEALRHKDVAGYGGVIFRDSYTQITSEGGLWDSSHKIFDKVEGAIAGKTPKLHWDFSGKSRLSFAHIGSDDDLGGWQGSQICYIGFDELTHFSKHQFIYMLSRNRSTCGIRPYIRATCNPDSDSWVAEFIEWWIDQDTGYPIPARSGQIRYMVTLNDVFYWADTREELIEKHGVKETDCKSVTFIASSLQDNKILMEIDPGYESNLKALTEVEKERLLYGNWKIKPAAGLMFKRSQVQILEALPNDIISWARGWDLAATSEDEKGDPAYTAGVLIGKRKNGRYIVANVINQRLSSSEVRALLKNTCGIDKATYKRVVQRLPQDPGQAGKAQKESFTKLLAGYVIKILPENGDKVTRAEPFSAQWQLGNVDVLAAEWNDMYFTQLESFPESKFKDMVDATSSAFAEIEQGFVPSPPSVMLTKESYWKKG